MNARNMILSERKCVSRNARCYSGLSELADTANFHRHFENCQLLEDQVEEGLLRVSETAKQIHAQQRFSGEDAEITGNVP